MIYISGSNLYVYTTDSTLVGAWALMVEGTVASLPTSTILQEDFILNIIECSTNTITTYPLTT